MEEAFLKLPSLPKNIKELIVKSIPWLVLILGLIGLLVVLLSIIFMLIITPIITFDTEPGIKLKLITALTLGFILSALSLAAVKNLFSTKILGWELLFLSELVSAVYSIVTFPTGILFTLVGFYILFQIKSYYK